MGSEGQTLPASRASSRSGILGYRAFRFKSFLSWVLLNVFMGCFSVPVPVGLLMSQDVRVSWRGALLIETAGT